MKLKQYQSATMDALRRFLEEARICGPAEAFDALTQEPEIARRLGRMRRGYRGLDALPDVPCICLRLPTGGGKTILAAHSVAVAKDAWIEKDFPIVLWLVPSNTIRLQTIEALKNPRHPYRQVLDEAFGGRVRVFDIADFPQLRPHDIGNQLCVIVGTIQTLKVENTEGRKVYAHHEELEPHFAGADLRAEELERDEKGAVKFSFANLLHLHRPLMIVDEAHNAVTGLSREMQKRVNPCAIIEFTATPKPASNTLFSVTAQELKGEEMIKLPIRLFEHGDWQNAVTGAIATRAMLAGRAAHDRDYIRPLVLFQAQPKGQPVTVEVLREHLIEVENIPEDQIAIATGDQRDLDGLNLFDPACPVQYIITVQALKEGWDCSLAYVFCSLQNLQSATAVEQLLGRVLRMPYARRRDHADLNNAWCHFSETSFGQTAQGLTDKLVAMGFSEEEAEENIIAPERDEFDLFGGGLREDAAVFTYRLDADSPALAALQQDKSGEIDLKPAKDGGFTLTIRGNPSPNVVERISAALPEAHRNDFWRKVEAHGKRPLSPSERGEKLVLPGLVVDIQGELELAEGEALLLSNGWSLLDHPYKPAPAELGVRDDAKAFILDLDGRSVSYRYDGDAAQISMQGIVDGWDEKALVRWLDPLCRQPDIGQGELLRWLGDFAHWMTGPRQIHINQLMQAKFALARKVKDRIAAIREAERGNVWQASLFGPRARPDVSFGHGFAFHAGMYQEVRRYRGSWKPNKHFLPFVPALDGKPGGEEETCAKVLDSLPEVKYWVRNVAQHSQSFWLPQAHKRFYPDFVAMLQDGRLFVVEYKGDHLLDSPDTYEKDMIGQLWEKRGGGSFLIVEKERDGLSMRDQMLARLKTLL